MNGVEKAKKVLAKMIKNQEYGDLKDKFDHMQA